MVLSPGPPQSCCASARADENRGEKKYWAAAHSAKAAGMKTVIGALGWAAVVALTYGLSSCDDTKATCEKMCGKMGECLPAQIDELTKSLPAGNDEMASKMKEEMKKKLEEGVQECKKKCEDPGEVKAEDKDKIKKVKECLDKDCKDFMKCLETSMK